MEGTSEVVAVVLPFTSTEGEASWFLSSAIRTRMVYGVFRSRFAKTLDGCQLAPPSMLYSAPAILDTVRLVSAALVIAATGAVWLALRMGSLLVMGDSCL